LLAGIAALNVPLLLNVFCHIPKLGYKNFQLKDDSVNVWWMALVCAGEGWHNNHHAYPASAKSGGKAWEIDPSWCVLRALKSVGLVTYMNESINDDRSDNKGELPGDGGPKVPLTVVLKEPEPASVV
jgi:fatty-acid desaturase